MLHEAADEWGKDFWQSRLPPFTTSSRVQASQNEDNDEDDDEECNGFSKVEEMALLEAMDRDDDDDDHDGGGGDGDGMVDSAFYCIVGPPPSNPTAALRLVDSQMVRACADSSVRICIMALVWCEALHCLPVACLLFLPFLSRFGL